ncbi:MAG: hypothetical protein ACFE7R_07280 [Candidatus Hodarchaeota archaeon]
MNAVNNPIGQRIAEVLIGFITLLAGLWILFDFAMLQITAFYILAVSLFLVGILRLLRASNRNQKYQIRVLNLIAGIVALGLSFVVTLLNMYQALLLFQFIGLGLLIVGIVRVGIGFLDDDLPNWARASLTVTGLLMVIVITVAILLPGLDLLVSILLITTALVANGFVRVFAGIHGRL